MKARGRKPKVVVQTIVNPNITPVKGIMDKSMPVPHPQNPNENYSNAVQHFIMLQNQHLMRLHYLFPEINPGALRKLLDLCNGDFIRTVDYILHMQRKNSLLKQKALLPNAGCYESKRISVTPYPIHHNNIGSIAQTPTNSNIQFPQRQIVNKNCPQPNHHMNYYPPRNGVNQNKANTSSIFINDQILQQRPNHSATGIQNSNVIQNIPQMPSQMLPTQAQTPQRGNVMLPPFESLKNVSNSGAGMSQINTNVFPDHESNLYTQYMMDSSAVIRNDMALNMAQQNNFGTFAENNVDSQTDTFAEQQMYKASPEVLPQGQRECWTQQQKLLEESQLQKLLEGSQWQKDLEQINVSLLPLSTNQDIESPAPKSVNDSFGAVFQETLKKDKKFPEDNTIDANIGVKLQDPKETDNHANIDFCYFIDSSVKRKLFPTDCAAEENVTLPDIDVSKTPNKKQAKELGKDSPNKVYEIEKSKEKILNDNGSNEKPDCKTAGVNGSTKKNKLSDKDGKNSRGFLNETHSPDNSVLVIDSDTEGNNNNGGMKEKKQQ